MSNLGLQHYLEKEGITLLRTKVGDRYVVEKMLEGDYNFGGEQSGHVISLAHSTTGDGPITAVQILNIARKLKKPLSELTSEVTLYPQILKNVRVARMQDYRSFPEIMSVISEAETALKNTGRILVRPSGTEPKIRIMVEGSSRALIEEIAGKVSGTVERLMA
jgi:phosphoglucosamine mutase